MANTYSKVYCQTVFAVKYRKAMIHDELKQKLFPVIGNLINEAGAQTIVVNGVEDHVHCLFRIFPKNSISEIMKIAKGKSSKWVNESGLLAHRFEWQSGFGAFSYSESDLHKVVKYIQNQEIHHRKVNLRQEYLKLLIDYKVDFSPEYLFQDLVWSLPWINPWGKDEASAMWTLPWLKPWGIYESSARRTGKWVDWP